LLAYLDKLRNEGKIWLTTVSHFADYQISLNDVIVNAITDNQIEIINKSTHSINGLSLIVKANAVTSTDIKFNQKRKGEELIIWFDLTANQKVTFKFN
jgi:predicted oxidoreductase